MLSLLLPLVACSQDDPEALTPDASSASCQAPSGLPAADATPVAESYFPLVDGAQWVYRHTGGTELWDETVTLTAQADGSYLAADTPGPSGTSSESTYVVSGTRTLRVAKTESTGDRVEASVDYDPGFARFDEAWPLLAEGCAETLDYARKEYDGAGQLVRDGDRSHTYTVEQVGVSVTVPAGTFDDCIVIYRVRERSVGSTASDEDNKRFWFCPGVGKVLEEDEGTAKREALFSCDIPGGLCP